MTEHRRSVRVVCLDRAEQVLLLEAADPTAPGEGPWWELPGGGLEPGETPEQAAVREVAEETGLRLDASAIPPALWRRSATYRWLGRRVEQDETVVVVGIPEVAPAVTWRAATPEEQRCYRAARWWPVAEVVASSARFYPGRLPALLPAVLAGQRIDEPFERWN